jgi:hypothetical protein
MTRKTTHNHDATNLHTAIRTGSHPRPTAPSDQSVHTTRCPNRAALHFATKARFRFCPKASVGVSTPCVIESQAGETRMNTDRSPEGKYSERVAYSDSHGSSEHKGQGVDTPRSPKKLISA